MASLSGSLDDTFHLAVPPAVARAHFADVDAVIANYGDLKSAEKLADDTVRFVLPTKNHGVTTFDGRYTCRWQVVDDHTVRWDTQGEGNMTSRGRATFRASGGGTVMHYQHTIELDLGVNRMVARMLRPVVDGIMRRELRAYVDRMIASL